MLIASKDEIRELFKEFADVYAINIQEQIEKAVNASQSNVNMSVKECSDYLSQCKKTTYTQILEGKITANRVGNKYLIPKNQFTK
ncbi:MAG: excisionase family DNA-binding protein [Lacinutrix sp.]|uniref:excisionase family DNA-binding protein n=1 Tax=Lacinutrix sp. TaxID=1937692 RepID=UPI0030B1379E